MAAPEHRGFPGEGGQIRRRQARGDLRFCPAKGWKAKGSRQKQSLDCGSWLVNAKHMSRSQEVIQYKRR